MLKISDSFYWCNAMYKRGIYCRKVSVCLSRSKTAKPIVEILPTSASPNILAFVEDSIVAKF